MEQNWKGFPPTHLVFTKFFQEHILKPDTQAYRNHWSKHNMYFCMQHISSKYESELYNAPDL